MSNRMSSAIVARVSAVASVVLLVGACAGAPGVPDPAPVDALPAVAEPVDPTADEVASDEPEVEDFASTMPEEQPERPSLSSEDQRVLDAALRAARRGQLQQARRGFESLSQSEAGAAIGRYNLGLLAFAEQDVSRGLQWMEDALAADPAYGPALRAIVLHHLALGDLRRAQARFDEARAAAPEAAPIEVVGLFLLLEEERWLDVIEESRRLIPRDEANVDIYVALGQANLALGRVELAGYIASQGLERDPGRVELYLMQAEIALADDGRSAAIAALRTAVSETANPLQFEVKNRLGVELLEARDFSEARTVLEEVTRMAPSFVPGWVNLGAALRGAGDASGAKAAYERAISLQDSAPEPWFNLGVLYMEGDVTSDRANAMRIALEHFAAYAERMGDSLSDTDSVHDYVTEARMMMEYAGRRPAARPTTAPSADPFGDEADDPFGDASDPFGEESDPFGDDGDPFGDAPDDPFGDDDPFGEDDDPFGEDDDPFGEDDDPFGDDDDPFAD